VNKFLYLTSQSGKLVRLNTNTHSHQLLYQDPGFRYLFGVGFLGNKLYFSGQTLLGMGESSSTGFLLEKVVDYFDPKWRRIKRPLRKFWFRIDSHLTLCVPDFHQLNIHSSPFT
jgi:hypothetical protein